MGDDNMSPTNFSFMECCRIGSISGLTLWNGEVFRERLETNNAAWFSTRKEKAIGWAEQRFPDSVLREKKPEIYGVRLSVAVPVLFYMKGLRQLFQDMYGSDALFLDTCSMHEVIRQDVIKISYDLPFNGMLISGDHYLLWNFDTYSVSID